MQQDSQYFIFQTMFGNLLLYALESKQNGFVNLRIAFNGVEFGERFSTTEEKWEEMVKEGIFKEIIFDDL